MDGSENNVDMSCQLKRRSLSRVKLGWGQYVPLKRRLHLNTLHGVIPEDDTLLRRSCLRFIVLGPFVAVPLKTDS
jgi:hypothetical protein